MDTFTRILVSIEGFFDRMGYWPIISSVTGAFRIVFGFFVALIGFKLMIGAICGMSFCHLFTTKKLTQICWKLARQSVRIMTNGRLNLMRGGVEVVPLLGNGAVWLYDQARQKAKLLPYKL